MLFFNQGIASNGLGLFLCHSPGMLMSFFKLVVSHSLDEAFAFQPSDAVRVLELLLLHKRRQEARE